jgi:UDP-glucuronate decarboxylase
VKLQGSVALVTGGAGFIGSHLCERLLAEDARVICLDNFRTGHASNVAHLAADSRFELVEHDVMNEFPEFLSRSAAVTHIYHLACPASPRHYQTDPEYTMLTNILGARNALRLAERTGARFLLASTSEVYGDPEVHPQREDYRGSVNCTGLRACYDEGKRGAETLAFNFWRCGRADVRVARIFNTYGPVMQRDDGRVVSNFICQALAGDDITIYGDGSQTRCFCYVDDTVEGLRRLMHSVRAVGVPVNLGNPHEITVNELAARVIDMTGSVSRILRKPLPSDDPTRRRPDIDRAIELLDWQPVVDLKAGLESTIEWFSATQRDLAREAPVLAAAE